MDKDGKFIKNLQDRLQHAEVQAPDGLFDAVQQEMSARGLVPASKPRKKLVWAWFLVPAAAAVAFAAVVLFRPATTSPSRLSDSILAEQHPSLPLDSIAVVADSSSLSVPVISNPSSVPMISTLPSTPATETDRLLADAAVTTATPAETPQEATMTSSSEVPEEENTPLNLPEQPSTALQEETPKDTYAGPDEDVDLDLEDLETEEIVRKRHARKVHFNTELQFSGVVHNSAAPSFGIKESVAPTAPEPSIPQYSDPNSRPVAPYDPGHPQVTSLHSTSPEEYSLQLVEGQDYIIKDMTHHLPVKVSAVAGIQITDWFRITTGVTYSYLASDFRMNITNPIVTGPREFSGKQQLHYMGLPLNLHFRLFEVSFFSAYVSGGAAMEGLVSGRQIYNGGQQGSTKLKDPTLFFSVNGAFGFNFHIYGPLNLYFEPSVNWYFDNKSPLDNAYNSHQFNVSMNLGLRFDL